MTTIQDEVDLDLMMKLGLSSIKKGSDDFNYIPNLINVAKTGLPIILSKGMASEEEVDKVVKTLVPINNKISIMHCVSVYPAKSELLNLNQILTLKKKYPEIVWGYSDHSIGTLACSVAVALGAKVIEKHYTLDKKLDGPDHWFSSDPDELKKLVDDIRNTEKSMGSGKIEVTKDELKSREIMRRKIVAKKNINEGDILSLDNVSFKRSVSGIDVSKWDKIRGSKAKKSIKINSGITEDKVNINNE
jgi:N,N'-diacetyllegionaminate synthase